MKREILSLNGVWQFCFDEDFNFKSDDISEVIYNDFMAVPAAFDATPAYNGKRGVAFYRKKIELSAGQRARLYFGAVGMYCKVFIDNKRIGEHYCAYTAFECNIPESEKTNREVVVMVCNRFDYEQCQHESFWDFYAYGGIFRDTELRLLPKGALIEWVGVDTLDYKTGSLKVIIKSTACSQNITLKIDDKEQYKFDNVDFTNGTAEFEIAINDFIAWAPETPELHSLTIDNENDSLSIQFGVRQVWTENGKIILNGKAVKLLGYCRHESHPQYGPALPLQQLVADLQMLRTLGCNFVRGSHYPQDQRFLKLCDEMGFLVFEESMSWQAQESHCTDERFIEGQQKQIEEMISAGYNNPSVIMRGFLNEGKSNMLECEKCYTTLINLIKEKDPTRLVTYASNQHLEDKFLDLIDIISFNIYPGWYSKDQDNEQPLEEIIPTINFYLDELKKMGLDKKPFIISEIGAGAIYGWRDPICAHWSEEYQQEYLRITATEVVENDKIAGVALWQFCDCRSYRGAKAVFRPRAFNNKGIVDEYRRPKLAYSTVKSIFTKANFTY
jgi:beta-glucuronidase